MRKITLITLAVLGISVSAFGQIKVNSSGRTFFGSGSSTTSYGAINLTADGTTNGISFTGTSANRYGIFKYNNELYMSPSNSYTRGLKVSATGGVYVTKDGLWGASGSTALTVCSSSDGVITGIGSNTSAANQVIIKAASDRADAYAFLVQYRPDWTLPFYVKADGTVYAKNGYLQSSDISNKEEVKQLENSLDKISALSAVSFYYKDFVEQTQENLSQLSTENNIESDSLSERINVKMGTIEQMKKEATRKRIGLIAQEVEEVVPEVVRTMDDGKKGIMYSDLVSLLIEGVKELKDIVDEKQSYIDELEGRLNSIEETLFTEKKLQNATGNNVETDSQIAKLSQNAPNPFNQETEISYVIPTNSNGYIGIYNLNGTQLKKYPLYSAQGNITISASELNPGIYIYSLIVDNKEIESKRMVLTD